MATLDFKQLEQLWIQAGGSSVLAPTMAAVALAESGGRTDALNNDAATKDYSVGLWQINYFGNLTPSRTKEYGSPSLLRTDPLANARAAVALARGGNGLGNWSTWKNGAFFKFVPKGANVALPVAGGGAVLSGGGKLPGVSGIGAGTNVVGKTLDSAANKITNPLTGWVKQLAGAAPYAFLYLGLVLFALVLALIGVLGVLGVHPSAIRRTSLAAAA